MSSIKQECAVCLMDETVPGFYKVEDGCNYCSDFRKKLAKVVYSRCGDSAKDLLVSKILRERTENTKYDCIVGLSGGIDSAWVLVDSVKAGLRPLAVHFDNGWNSEISQTNIYNLVQGLGVDLFTVVADWTNYREMMQCFFDAHVVDIELLTDNVASAVLYKASKDFNVKYLLSGSNTVTEGISMPPGWNWYKLDKRNIQAITRGIRRAPTIPLIGTFEFWYHEYFRKIQNIPYLEYVDYNLNKVIATLSREFGFVTYSYKHYESIFTRFYQGYLLPQKFGIDKRKMHLSALVVSGQLTRSEALSKLANQPYESQAQLEIDKKYFLKKMLWDEERLDTYISDAVASHLEYPSEAFLMELKSKLSGSIPKSIKISVREMLGKI